MYSVLPAFVCAPYTCNARRGQKRAPNALALELQTVVRSQWAGNRSRVLGRAAGAPSHGTTFLAPVFDF